MSIGRLLNFCRGPHELIQVHLVRDRSRLCGVSQESQRAHRKQTRQQRSHTMTPFFRPRGDAGSKRFKGRKVLFPRTSPANEGISSSRSNAKGEASRRFELNHSDFLIACSKRTDNSILCAADSIARYVDLNARQ
jgi:hypothetical protein